MGFTVLGGGGWAYLARQKTTRQAATERVVMEAIDRATLLRGQAEAAPVGDLVKWTEALAAANQASSSLKLGETSESLQERVNQLLTNLERERADAMRQANELAQDRAFFDRLEAIRFEFAQKNEAQYSWKDQETAVKADAAYAAAFRDFGIDPVGLDPAEAARRFRQRSQPINFAYWLDDWTLIHKAATTPYNAEVDAICLRLIETAKATDDDAWRNSIRSLIAQWDHPAARRLAADKVQLCRQPARSLNLLAEVLEDTRGRFAWATRASSRDDRDHETGLDAQPERLPDLQKAPRRFDPNSGSRPVRDRRCDGRVPTARSPGGIWPRNFCLNCIIKARFVNENASNRVKLVTSQNRRD